MCLIGPYSSVKLERASWPVILSGEKNLSSHREILLSTQNDSQRGAMKGDRVLHASARRAKTAQIHQIQPQRNRQI
jgi:hypothetical protein